MLAMESTVHASQAFSIAHAFCEPLLFQVLVPIRDEKLKLLPGVRVEDMGHKIGLNGVDNAKISFDNVRVPRENLLNRFSDVSEVNIVGYYFGCCSCRGHYCFYSYGNWGYLNGGGLQSREGTG